MKKTLRLMGLCALAVLALAGCKKDEQTGTKTFKATISQLNSDARTEINADKDLVWNEGDEIKVYTEDKTEVNAANFTLATGIGQTEATFTGELATSETYYAFYPTTDVEVNGDGNFKLPLSATQNFVDGSFATGTFPMFALYDNGNFAFQSPYGVLAIPMTGSGSVTSVVLTGKKANNSAEDLSGYYWVNPDATNHTFVAEGQSITLDCGNGVALSDAPTTFCFVVPGGAFAGGFTVQVNSVMGELATFTTTQSNTVSATKIHMMPTVTIGEAGNGATTDPVDPTTITTTSCTLVGSVTYSPGLLVEEVGFYYGTVNNGKDGLPSNLTEKVTVDNIPVSGETFTYTLEGLTPGTDYQYVAYMKASNKEIYGTVQDFSTDPVNHLIDLSTLTGDYEAQDGDTLTNTLAGNHKITVADGATVTLSNATITYSSNSSSNNYAGITCPGDATLVLAGTNTVQPAYNNWPAIQVATSHTLTIRGEGSLNATNTGDAAAIGAGGPGHACGNIVIESGNITATSINAAAIGGGQSTTGTCGNITISGGTVNATSSQCAGIGGGQGFGSCGNIIISGGNVTATSNYSCAGIGAGMGYASCGTITISGDATIVNATSASGTGIGAGLSNSSCGAITISGGNITARSNSGGAGIGAGTGSSNCGTITITDGVGSVTAIKGSGGQYCIGKAEGGTSCGTITIGGTEYPSGVDANVDDVTFVYPFQDPELTTGNVTDYQTAGTGHVTLTNAGTGPVTELGLCWGTSSTPTVSNSHAAAAGQTVGTVYDVNITGLTPGTIYYVRGYAKVGPNYYYASNTRTLTLVSSLSDWNNLASIVNDGTAATVQAIQTANISGVTTVVGTESQPFNGTYNGQGYAISNVSIHGSTHVGLFGYVNDASAVIENVVVASGSVSGTGQNVGAIVGTVYKGTVRYCANYAQVSSSLNTSDNTRVGGIVGWMRSNGGTDNHVEYCINYGAVHAKYYVGGVVGSHGSGYLTYCQNYGTITGNFNTSAGIAGWSTDYEYVTNNHNGGNIIAGSTSNKVERFVIGNKNGNEGFPSNNTYLSSLTVTSAGTVYTGSSLSSFTWATALTSNPAGITIGGTTYGPTTPAP